MAEGLEMGKDPHDPTHSRTLFVREDGSSISFYVRPGPAKRRLSTLILHGGGTVCRVQESEAVLLAQPGEAQAEASGDFISTQYITDCVEQNERLDLEDYRLGRREPGSPGAAREPEAAYTEDDDVAIVRYVKDNARSPSALAGTTLWKALEKAGLTPHPWQSMKDRYLKHLKGLEQKYLEGEELASPAQKPKRKAEGPEPADGGNDRFDQPVSAVGSRADRWSLAGSFLIVSPAHQGATFWATLRHFFWHLGKCFGLWLYGSPVFPSHLGSFALEGFLSHDPTDQSSLK